MIVIWLYIWGGIVTWCLFVRGEKGNDFRGIYLVFALLWPLVIPILAVVVLSGFDLEAWATRKREELNRR